MRNLSTRQRKAKLHISSMVVITNAHREASNVLSPVVLKLTSLLPALLPRGTPSASRDIQKSLQKVFWSKNTHEEQSDRTYLQRVIFTVFLQSMCVQMLVQLPPKKPPVRLPEGSGGASGEVPTPEVNQQVDKLVLKFVGFKLGFCYQKSFLPTWHWDWPVVHQTGIAQHTRSKPAS